MNDDLLNNPRLELDEDMISKINETLEKELNRIESFPNSNFCDELTHEFNQISSNLENMGFMEECRYFRSIEGMVLYIIRKNSHNNHFEHYDFAFQLLNFFTELFKRNLEFYNDHVSFERNDFKLHRDSCKKKYHDYRRIFYQKIYKTCGNFTEEELYEILKGWNV